MNGATAGQLPHATSPTEQELVIPHAVIGSSILEIELRPSDYRSPKALGTDADERELGIAVLEMAVERAE